MSLCGLMGRLVPPLPRVSGWAEQASEMAGWSRLFASSGLSDKVCGAWQALTLSWTRSHTQQSTASAQAERNSCHPHSEKAILRVPSVFLTPTTMCSVFGVCYTPTAPDWAHSTRPPSSQRASAPPRPLHSADCPGPACLAQVLRCGSPSLLLNASTACHDDPLQPALFLLLRRRLRLVLLLRRRRRACSSSRSEVEWTRRLDSADAGRMCGSGHCSARRVPTAQGWRRNG